MLEFLSPRLLRAVRHVNLNALYELRIRKDLPLRANLNGSFVWLGEIGVVSNAEAALRPTQNEVDETLFAASDYSVYSVENQIKQGFVTAKCGERVGIAGSFVYEKGETLAIRSVTSLCVRIPHAVYGCAEEIYERCLSSDMQSLLLLSPPGMGKTTLLRDLCRLVSERKQLNVLASDERGELSAGNLGTTSDVIKFADKLTAFTAGIRAMRPDVIVTDELLESDYRAVKRAMDGGIIVFASAHLNSFESVPEKLFDRYILLCDLGKIKAIYDREGHYVD